MASKEKKVSYFNTLIFTIITGVLSLGILGLLLYDIGKDFVFFIVTLEAGIFIIIGYCIYRIISHEKAKEKASQEDRYVVNFDTCPDYYVKRMVGDKEYCFNDYTVKDETGKTYIMKVYPMEVNGTPIQIPPTIRPSNNVGGNEYLFEKFDLHALESDPTLKTYKDKCNLVYQTPADRMNQYSHIPSLPWTFAQSRCESLADKAFS